MQNNLQDLGRRIIEAARMAVLVHVAEGMNAPENRRQRAVIGGADSRTIGGADPLGTPVGEQAG